MAVCCADASLAAAEPLHASAPRAEHWLCVEVRAAWAPEPLETETLPGAVRDALRGQLDAFPRSKLCLLRRPERRGGPLAVFAARTAERSSRLVATEVDALEELADLDLPSLFASGEEACGPLVLVCAHGKRDPCCARFGPPVFDALRAAGARAEVWQTSHLGGHRFAANVALLPHGLVFGRVRAEDAAGLARRLADDEIDLARYRGRCFYPLPVQAAEQALRERRGLVRPADLELAEVAQDGDRWRVTFGAGGELVHVEVAEEPGEPIPLSCGEEPRPTGRFSVS
jgi:hypothetical protein